jgi:hypothetical protein
MSKETVLVDVVRSLAKDRARGKSAKPRINIRFASGAVGRLNPDDPRERVWAEVLESLRESKKPAYIELNTSTGRITSLLLPRAHEVIAIRDAEKDGDLEVELHRSHAVHYLRRRHPRFEELRELLEEAIRSQRSMLVTKSLDGSAIVDIRPAKGGK